MYEYFEDVGDMGFKPIDRGIICAIYYAREQRAYGREQQANTKRRDNLKRKLILIPILVLALALSFSLVTAVPVAADGPPAIDGAIGTGEWDGATVIPVAGNMGTVSVIAERDYLYVLLDVVDSNDARTQYVNEVGNDQISININPTDGGSWGFPYDIIFETSALSDGVCNNCPDDGGHHCLPWNPKVNSGTIDGWSSRWFPNNAQANLPSDLESATVYSGGRRITEWKIPLATIDPLPSTLKVGGAIDVGDGNSYVYPVGLNWSDASTFIDIPVPPPPPPTKADILKGSGIPGKGLDTAPGLQKPFNPNSQAGEHAGKK